MLSKIIQSNMYRVTDNQFHWCFCTLTLTCTLSSHCFIIIISLLCCLYYDLVPGYFLLLHPVCCLFIWQPWFSKLTRLIFHAHTHVSASAVSARYQPNTLCICVLTEMLLNTVRSPVSAGGARRKKASLPVCLWGDTTIMSMRPSTLASTVSLLRPVCLSTRWMDLVCQSVQ